MSNVLKAFAKQKLGHLPHDPPLSTNSVTIRTSKNMENPTSLASLAIEDDSSSASSSSISSVGTIRPTTGQEVRNDTSKSSNAYSPKPWNSGYTDALQLSWEHSPFIYNAYYTPPVTPEAPLFVLIHGAGCSGLSFAACAAHLKSLAPDIGLFAADARGHGETRFRPEYGDDELVDGKLNMSLERLADDLEAAIELLKKNAGWATLPNIVLIGHSLGGAVVTEVAARGKFGRKVLAFAVLDVVEGSALDALRSMNAYLAARPRTFPSLETGIEWHIRSRTIRNPESACISVPSYLRPIPASDGEPTSYAWMTDLSSTNAYWSNWFDGMSRKFLEARGGKLLILAGTDRLDKELMIGQMQGKYQLHVLPEAGHFIQEDVPEKTARLLIEFWKRNDGSLLVLPPKVGATAK